MCIKNIDLCEVKNFEDFLFDELNPRLVDAFGYGFEKSDVELDWNNGICNIKFYDDINIRFDFNTLILDSISNICPSINKKFNFNKLVEIFAELEDGFDMACYAPLFDGNRIPNYLSKYKVNQNCEIIGLNEWI